MDYFKNKAVISTNLKNSVMPTSNIEQHLYSFDIDWD
jgi:hypothetical protein